MATYKTFGPVVHGIMGRFVVCPLIEIVDDPPTKLISKVIDFVVLDGNYGIVHRGNFDTCKAIADEKNAEPEPEEGTSPAPSM
ncbi:hypothetical protein [Methylobacterium aquaticum]|jgi:hypothetical protein|uniref:hypothetical protein n=1 Tax=Methylobacterium aquaticum TaxID=270351 RepID=UPI000B0B222E|nr:hypothetical protein [Methylobacterium aquaticum]